MIIQCPNCQTRFRLDDARLSSRRAILKCSRCQHIFPAPREDPPAGRTTPPEQEAAGSPPPANAPRRPAQPQRSSPTAQENLSFTFGDDEEEWDAELLHPESPAEEQFSIDDPPQARPRRRSEKPEWDATPEQGALLFEDSPDGEEESEEDDAGESLRSGISLKPVIVFLILVVTGYAVLAATLYANQEWTEQLAQGMPFIGAGGRDRLLSRKVTLVGFQASYERTKEGKSIFVVTGQAVNHASVALGGVQVLAKLLDSQGNVLDQHVIFCGSAVPAKILRDLSIAEVSIIGRLKPPKLLLVQPGESSPCMAVFTDPSSRIAEFTTEVVAAQRQA